MYRNKLTIKIYIKKIKKINTKEIKSRKNM
jgi:hypothetical protein